MLPSNLRDLFRSARVRYWHKADKPTAPAFVRYWTKADKGGFWRAMARSLMTHLGHSGPGERILQPGHGYEF